MNKKVNYKYSNLDLPIKDSLILLKISQLLKNFARYLKKKVRLYKVIKNQKA